MVSAPPTFSRKTIIVAACLAAASIPLSKLHAMFSLAALPLCAVASYSIFNGVSRALFKKEYQPPTRIGIPEWRPERRWSDWLLFVPEVLLFVGLLFLFGNVGDCMSHRHVWVSWWSLCST
jgi:hypothetical protein